MPPVSLHLTHCESKCLNKVHVCCLEDVQVTIGVVMVLVVDVAVQNLEPAKVQAKQNRSSSCKKRIFG